ncbi:MAG: DUF1854 domain-containing protein [Verrucomicrobia bacterium]|nr:DUF1854 domain-containing protein [Verrucomicrobiota bacterium]
MNTLTLPTAVAAFRAAKNIEHLNPTPADALELVVDTDISFEGSSERHWLVSGAETLSVVRDHDHEVLRSIEWAEIESARTISCVGCGLLQVRIHGQWSDLLRFSNALSERFHKVSRRLDRRCERARASDESDGGAESLPFAVIENVADEPLDPPRCPTCDLRLAKHQESCPRCLQKGQILARVWELLKPHWRGSLGVVALTVLGIAAELLPPKLQQYMVDHILVGKVAADVDVHQALLFVVLALAISRVLLSFVGIVKGRLSSIIGSGITCNLRKKMVGKLQGMAVSYYDRHEVGSLISRVAHDSEVLHGLMHQITGGFLLQIGQLVGVGAMLVWLNPKLALFTLIPVPLVFLGSWIFWRKVYPRYYRLWDASSKQMAALSGMLSGIRVVKAFAQEDREEKRFSNAAEHLRDWRVWVEHANARYSAAMQIVFSLGGLIVWYVGGRDVIGTEMTLGQLIAFLAYLAMFYAPLGALSNFTTWLTSFLSGSKRVLEVLDAPLSIMDPEKPVAWGEPKGELVFDRVTFGYDPNQPVLKDIAFTVKPGEMVGIVGRSGSGKTTMVNLLGRFYDPQEGSVRIDGIDVRDLSLQELRRHVGVVFQDSFLFRGTIWKNLSYGRPDTEVNEGLAKAKASGAHDFICNKTLAYETLLGEHGSGLSGGEKQRLSIARTLLYDPKILILDEATSNIDAESEKSIQEALEVLVKGRTTVAIAHRLSTLRNADRILVFDRGRLIEEGSHAELLQKDGTYARLVRIQTQVSKDPNVDKLLGFEGKPGAATATDTESKTDTTTNTDVLTGKETESDAAKPSTGASREIRWLDPTIDCFIEIDGELCLVVPEKDEPIRVFPVRTFPASQPWSYLSLRTWSKDGDDAELGMIRELQDWPEATRAYIRAALRRRYLLRPVHRVHSAELAHGYLQFDIDTDGGRSRFTLRWSGENAADFGEKGKLLVDTEGNRWVVEDVEALPAPDRERFVQHIYW